MRKIISIFIISFLFASYAQAITGSINSTSHTAKVCHSVDCITPTPGSINFIPTTGDNVIVDTVTGLTGQIWGNELGWIDLHPTGAGVTFANPTTGLLTGKAWSQVSGWINFAPTGEQVNINMTSGEFSGYAWTGGPEGGWIKFDCSDTSSCVKVNWPTSSGGGGGGSGGYRDVCPNISGIQASIPSGYTISIDGLCVQAIDMCPNIIGDQNAIPEGFVLNIIGACIPNIDYCPNLKDIQTTIPPSYIINTKGDCIIPKKDMCPNVVGIQDSTSQCNAIDVCTNVPGIQSTTPTGYTSSNNFCYIEALDLCRNIEGKQTTIPEGQILNGEGNCVVILKDICPNLAGHQDHVPPGFSLEKNICIFNQNETEDISKESKIPTIGFPFIPSQWQMPSDNPFLKYITRNILNTVGEFKVDLVSAGISLLALLIIVLLFFIWVMKKLMR